jgi:hypothetical protein
VLLAVIVEPRVRRVVRHGGAVRAQVLFALVVMG